MLNRFKDIFDNKKTHILIACFPKSGSTYLASILREITSFRRGGLDLSFHESRGLSVSKQKIEKYRRINTVSKQHLLATDNNIQLLIKHNYRVIVLVRNLYDVILSLHDYIVKANYRTTGYIHRPYFEMSPEDQLMYLIRVHLPWYFCFLISWDEVDGRIPLFWVSYEQLFDNQVRTLSNVLEFYDLPVDEKSICRSIESIKTENTRFNVGTRGRGMNLSDAHKDAILELADCWKADDSIMKRVGIVR